MDIARTARIVYAVVSLVVVESVVFGLASMPGLLTFRLITNTFRGIAGGYFEAALLGLAFVPAYFVFCLALMFLTAMATRLLRWRSIPGRYSVRDVPWGLVRWAQYNSAIHIVRVFAGSVLRSTPFWTWFLKINGARIGRSVHVNALTIYDHNLLNIGNDTVIGSDVKLICHVAEHGELIVSPVAFGRRVTIGANTIIFPGVTIGDSTAVGAMSLVTKGSVLEPNSTYAGIPARRLEEGEAAVRRRVRQDAPSQ